MIDEELMQGYREAAGEIMADEETQYGVINDVTAECPRCYPAEGKKVWLGFGDNPEGLPSIDDFPGLFHPNCRHYVIPWQEGMDLEEMFPITTYDQLGYEVSQYENYVVRNLEYWQRRYAAALGDTFTKQHLDFWYGRWVALQNDPVGATLKFHFKNNGYIAQQYIKKLFGIHKVEGFTLATERDWIDLTKAIDRTYKLTGDKPYILKWYNVTNDMYLNATTDFMGGTITMSHGLNLIFDEKFCTALAKQAIAALPKPWKVGERELIKAYLDSARIANGKLRYAGQMVINVGVIPSQSYGIVGMAYEHEFGHWLHYSYLPQFDIGGLFGQNIRMSDEAAALIADKLPRGGDTRYYAVSIRSFDSWEECVAENWALYFRGYKQYMRREMVTLIEKIIKGKVKPLTL